LNGFLFFSLGLLLFLKFSRQAFLHTGYNLAIYLFKLNSLIYLLTFIEDPILTLPELLLKNELIPQKQFARYDDVDETIVNSVYFVVLAYLLI
jgi:hypothetical protein